MRSRDLPVTGDPVPLARSGSRAPSGSADTMWMSQPCRSSCMNGTSTPYVLAHRAVARRAVAHCAPAHDALALSVAVGGLEQIHQPAEGLQVAAGFLEQGRQLGGAELAGHAVLPVLRGLAPGVVEQPELLVAVLIRSGNHDQEAGAWTRRAASRLAMMATRCSSIRGSSFSSRSANRPAVPWNSLASASIRCCQRRIDSSRSAVRSTAWT